MALAKLPITIKIRGGKIIDADIPKSQANAMNNWLEENNHSHKTSGWPLAREIEKHYPGGPSGWSRDTNYPVDIRR